MGMQGNNIYIFDKYIKTRIKTYKDSITTNFYNKNGSKKIPEEKVPHKCLSIILDSVICGYEKYHPQIFLEESKYIKEHIKTKNYIDIELESRSDTEVILILIVIVIFILKNRFEKCNKF